jgi:hypothetical protein
LQNEDVLASNILENLHHYLAVAEAANGCASHADVQVPHHVLRQLGIGVAGKNHQAIVGHDLEALSLKI